MKAQQQKISFNTGFEGYDGNDHVHAKLSLVREAISEVFIALTVALGASMNNEEEGPIWFLHILLTSIFFSSYLSRI